ncbi:hypothetical protein HIM_10545 [Hirsutella minnesotensis 3608]|uniref:Uncharacterized protein n=1 Tax=Hirsutella minnesotensis 3608 TaxID=1043627 RepID=A0A0F7ZX41_9HYPO|nr:hypothetical protein HIM_10545 [Hirsutella minnesotensis 3608]
MKTFNILPALLAALTCINAAPVENVKRETNFGGIPGSSMLSNTPLNGVGSATQGAGAEVFKAGDAILNTPIDAIGKVMNGNPMGALTGLGSNVMGLVGSLPGDLMGMAGSLTGGGIGGGAKPAKPPKA